MFTSIKTITQQFSKVAFSTATAVLLTTGLSFADDMMTAKFPQPTPEHQWLQQLVGDWESETAMTIEPGKPAEVSTGTEHVEALGGFWTLSEIKGTMMQKPFVGNMTLGYDTEAEKYIGTWVDSMTGKLWKYEGTLDESKKKLTLKTAGECALHPGKISQFKEVLELTDANHKTYTSSVMGDDGQWVTMFTSHATRK